MLRTKLDEVVSELRLATRFLRNFQRAECSKLRVEVANLAGELADPAEELEKLLLVAAVIGNELCEQSLDAAGGGAKSGNRLRSLAGGQLQEIALRLAE